MQRDTSPVWLSDLDVANRYGIKSRITVWRWAKAGHIPKPKKIAPNTTRWSAAELDAHDARIMEVAG